MISPTATHSAIIYDDEWVEANDAIEPAASGRNWRTLTRGLGYSGLSIVTNTDCICTGYVTCESVKLDPITPKRKDLI